MSELPELVEMDDFPGDSWPERWNNYVEALYARYLASVVHESLKFRSKRVNCQFRPETDRKHFAFWHMIQEGSGGRREDDRTPDMERCRRIDWIAWVIRNAEKDDRIRVFTQKKRGSDQPWAFWLYEEDYLVILWERKNYFLLKTAFVVSYENKRRQLENDWKNYQEVRF